jgi:hypothetical protein
MDNPQSRFEAADQDAFLEGAKFESSGWHPIGLPSFGRRLCRIAQDHGRAGLGLFHDWQRCAGRPFQTILKAGNGGLEGSAIGRHVARVPGVCSLILAG